MAESQSRLTSGFTNALIVTWPGRGEPSKTRYRSSPVCRSGRIAIRVYSWLVIAFVYVPLVVVAIGYHHACRSLLRKFEEFANVKSERWFRVFNESAVLLVAAIVVLVVVKPF